jgi:DNA-binding response OmpR family regulator
MAPNMKSLRIVLLEDEELLCHLFEEWIRGCFKEVDLVTFRNGDAAWQELSRREPDLFITDEVHLGLRGSAIISKLAGQKARCSILLVSGFPGDCLTAMHAKTGVKFFILPKPFLPKEFLERLKTLVSPQRQSPASRNLNGDP